MTTATPCAATPVTRRFLVIITSPNGTERRIQTDNPKNANAIRGTARMVGGNAEIIDQGESS